MTILSDVPLASYSTMGLGGNASFLCEVTTRMDVLEALSWAQEKQLPAVLIGTGSNVVWRDQGYPGLVIIDRIRGYSEYNEDDLNTYITVGAGEEWDSVVARSVARGLSGIEALSLIPGTAGATPVQNVGAYGQDISQVLVSLEAFDTEVKDFVTIPAADCAFSYRNSRFKTKDKSRFYITALTLHLTKSSMYPPFYPALAVYLESHDITSYDPLTIRNAVIAIRQSKLPDPAIVKNCGSFFANPIIDRGLLEQLQVESNVSIPHWNVDDTHVKVSAAWLIENAGFKDIHDQTTGMATWATQPLVLVNEHANSTAQLLAFKQVIVTTVQDTYRITLEQEPELLPTIA